MKGSLYLGSALLLSQLVAACGGSNHVVDLRHVDPTRVIKKGLIQAEAVSGPELPFLHPMFSDHAVLQRDKAVPLWGWAKPGALVEVKIATQTVTTTADALGRWEAMVGPFPAGGPYALEVVGDERVNLQDLYFGDVWLCSGQSNMQFATGQVLNATQELAASTIPGVRLLQVPQVFSKTPAVVFERPVAWTLSDPDTVAPFSAACFFFGRELHEKLGIPIGLIHSSWGGTPAEAWTSQEQLATIPDFAATLASLPAARIDQNSATVLYNSMIAPLLPYQIKGAAWYQGESNASRAGQYSRLLPTLINDWRQRFKNDDLPFYIVQLANYTGTQTSPVEDSSWAALREAQLNTSLNLKASGLAVAIDIGEAWDIHPKDKQDVGLRLAASALARTYGQQGVASGPIFTKAAIEGDRLRLYFKETGRGLSAGHKDGLAPVQFLPGAKLTGFALAGSDKSFVWADAVIDGEQVVLSAAGIKSPVAARYDWASNPIGNLYNLDGLPASPFRTDPDYTVSVNSGSGSGVYQLAQRVPITAGAAPAGQSFAGWIGDTEVLADPKLPSTTLVVPAHYVSLAPSYR